MNNLVKLKLQPHENNDTKSNLVNNFTTSNSIFNVPDIKIAIGFPSNAGAGNKYTIYSPDMNAIGVPTVNYHQTKVLGKLKSQIKANNLFSSNSKVKGIMTWSLNNDYMPKWYQDNFAVRGAFCENIFGATGVSRQKEVPYMTLSVAYATTGELATKNGGIVVSLITDSGKNYNLFGYPLPDMGGCRPLTMKDNPAKWCTITPIADGSISITKESPKPWISESGSLDQLASDASSTHKIKCMLMVSYYKEGAKGDLAKPTIQSQFMPVTLYTRGDNVLTVSIKNLDNDELPPGYVSPGDPSKNGYISYSYTNNPSFSLNNTVTTNSSAFWWSANVPSLPPAWLMGALKAVSNMVMNATLGDVLGEFGFKLLKILEGATGEKFEICTDGEKDETEPKTTIGPITIKYIVKRNDTLMKIAGYYNISLHALQNANPILDGGTKIDVGQALKIPLPTTHKGNNPTFSGKLPLSVGYVQLGGEHSVNATTLPYNGIASCNIIVFAFAEMKSGSATIFADKVSENYIDEIKYVINNAPKSTQFFLSVGGANFKPVTLTEADNQTIVSSVYSQIEYINGIIPAGSITGVDLDMEHGVSSVTILALIEGFKKLGYKVSLAPQLVSTDGKDINSANPSINLGLATSLNSSQFNKAIQHCKSPNLPDYIFLQCYNSHGISVDGADEQNPEILSNVFTALNNLVHPLTNKVNGPNSITNVPDIKIAIGFPSNAGAGNKYTIYDPYMNAINVPTKNKSGGPSYIQKNVLNNLKNQFYGPSKKIDFTTSKNVKGIMTWSLNNDYMPKWYQDNFAVRGAFCETVFGANEVLPENDVPYMTLNLVYAVDKKAQSLLKRKGGIVLTLITKNNDGSKNYNLFGYPLPNMGGIRPLTMSDHFAKWCTITPISEGKVKISDKTPWISESGNLDQIASNTNAGAFSCDMMVTYYKEGQTLGTSAKDLIQSEVIPMTLYAPGDNVITIGLNNLDVNELNAFKATNNKDEKNGVIGYIYKNGTTAQKKLRKFWWDANKPSKPPEWVLGTINAIAGIAIDSGFDKLLGSTNLKLGKVLLGADGTSLEDIFEFSGPEDENDPGKITPILSPTISSGGGSAGGNADIPTTPPAGSNADTPTTPPAGGNPDTTTTTPAGGNADITTPPATSKTIYKSFTNGSVIYKADSGNGYYFYDAQNQTMSGLITSLPTIPENYLITGFTLSEKYNTSLAMWLNTTKSFTDYPTQIFVCQNNIWENSININEEIVLRLIDEPSLGEFSDHVAYKYGGSSNYVDAIVGNWNNTGNLDQICTIMSGRFSKVDHVDKSFGDIFLYLAESQKWDVLTISNNEIVGQYLYIKSMVNYFSADNIYRSSAPIMLGVSQFYRNKRVKYLVLWSNPNYLNTKSGVWFYTSKGNIFSSLISSSESSQWKNITIKNVITIKGSKGFTGLMADTSKGYYFYDFNSKKWTNSGVSSLPVTLSSSNKLTSVSVSSIDGLNVPNIAVTDDKNVTAYYYDNTQKKWIGGGSASSAPKTKIKPKVKDDNVENSGFMGPRTKIKPKVKNYISSPFMFGLANISSPKTNIKPKVKDDNVVTPLFPWSGL